MAQSGYNIDFLVQEAKIRWLRPAEVHFILQNHDINQHTNKPLQMPPSGSLFLVNKRVLRFFRNDGHKWRKKKDGRNVGEGHERLKVGNVEALNCYYAHGEQNSAFRRRSYWMLDPAYEHIVLVHYRDISKKTHSGSTSQRSPLSSTTFSHSSVTGGLYDRRNAVPLELPDFPTSFDNRQDREILDTDSTLRNANKQKFTIREISPEWGYATENTKVIIVGSVLCDYPGSAWMCMFGDIEVPLQIIQEGVFLCQAPPLFPGRVTLYITSGNGEYCSEIKEFEYCAKPSICPVNNLPEAERTRSPGELLLLVKFVQLLLSDSSINKSENIDSENGRFEKPATEKESLDLIEAFFCGNRSSSSTIEWLLLEVLKDKLLQWLSSKSKKSSENPVCSLSSGEQGIIHLVSGLGFDWALSPILDSGVNVNFRDNEGWTALHWAARFGREKTVTKLIATGAFAGAITDPKSEDPNGKTPATIAEINGHEGLAGFLSELALTSHLLSLTLEESELSRGSAEIEADKIINRIPLMTLSLTGDQESLKETLAASRNAIQSATRIQCAFREHSFRKRQQREAALREAAFREAALSIQKKYRGWKGRQNFLGVRKKVVKIQAHVRGYQARKRYVVCWAVGVMEKVILRWLRKKVGLRGFQNAFTDKSEDEDILKVYRKQKVYPAIAQAVDRVLHLANSLDARQQYQRILEKQRQEQARDSESEVAPASFVDFSDVVDLSDMMDYDILTADLNFHQFEPPN